MDTPTFLRMSLLYPALTTAVTENQAFILKLDMYLESDQPASGIVAGAAKRACAHPAFAQAGSPRLAYNEP